MEFEKLLRLMVEKGGSDLFITAGVPPSMKVNGKIMPVTKNAMSPEQTRETVLGVMNEFVYLAEGYRDQDGTVDPVALSLKLAGTPCGPLYKGAVFPDKALRELVYGGPIH
mgnify:CR=1 FL=1